LHGTIQVSLESKYDAKHKLAKNRRGSATTVMIQHSYLELHYFSVEKNSNNHNPKSIHLHGTIQVSLESKYDAKHKLAKNRRGSAMTVMIRHTYLELHYFSVEKTQTTITPRVSSRMAQYRYH
jgi:hypothetical protein